MSPSPSYYDSIGLLAICDAIDAVEGIPFHPVTKPKPLPAFGSHKIQNIGKASRAKSTQFSISLGKNAPIQHIMLTHIPVTGIFSPFGTMPYEEQQQMAINQLASTGQLPPQPPAHTIGGLRPNIPVAHNLHGDSAQPSRSASMPQSPGPGHLGRTGSPSASATPLGMAGMANQSMPGKTNTTSTTLQRPTMASSVGTPQPLARSESPQALGTPGIAGGQAAPLAMPSVQGSSSSGAPGVNTAPGGASGAPSVGGSGINSPGMNSPAINGSGVMNPPFIPSRSPVGAAAAAALPGQNLPLGQNYGVGMPPGALPHSSQAPSSTGLDSRASTPGSPADSSHTRVEVCQICGRDFKGRKAATHKQQHIRRLHPAEYTPKRGGKKSRTD